jgi:hypothetical protein
MAIPYPDEHPSPPPGRKSVGLAVALALLLGPLGLFYASVSGGLFTLFLAIVVGIGTVGLGLIPVWILCVAWAYVAVQQHNEALDRAPPP